MRCSHLNEGHFEKFAHSGAPVIQGAPKGPRSPTASQPVFFNPMQKNDIAFGGLSLPGVPVNLALATLRILAGAGMALGHGWLKLPVSEKFVEGVGDMGFPLPIVFAWAAALSEFLGGILVAVGFLTRPAAFFVMCTMMVAAFLRHSEGSFLDREGSLLYGAVFLLFTVIGASRLSIDALIRKK